MAPNILSTIRVPPKSGEIDIYDSSTAKPNPNKEDFHWVPHLEPHRERRLKILKDHPEIRELYGHDSRTALITVVIVATQTWLATWVPQASWPVFLFIAFFLGGTMNHTLFLANHELSHGLGFKQNWLNGIFGILTNFPTLVPSSHPFKFYHFEHHMLQGVDGVDTDVPSDWEVKYIRGSFLKFVFVTFQILSYATRPLMAKPLVFNRWIILGAVVQMSYNYYMCYYFGWGAILYFACCSLFGGGLNPVAGHFIAEHYEFVEGYETYSYIGPANWLNFNVGYHIEHHDFPKIPWSNIWKVREIAPEWYNYPIHTSYTNVIWNYIFDDRQGPFSRIKRKDPKKK